MAVRGGCRPLSGLICEIVNSVDQRNFTFVREKSGNFKHLWLWQPCIQKQKNINTYTQQQRNAIAKQNYCQGASNLNFKNLFKL